MPMARTEEVAPSQYQYERFRMPPVMQMERVAACNQIPSIINENLRQWSFGFSASQHQARKYSAGLFATPLLLRWITWIVARSLWAGVG